MPSDRADLVIAGGGPAGLALAVSARLRGLSVVVLERRRPPVDAACGEGIMPAGADRLRELGVTVPAECSASFEGIRFVDGGVRAEGRFAGAPGLAVRRTVLHAALARRAEELGADLRWGVRVRGLTDDGFDTDRGPVRGSLRVGADGRLSRVRAWAGLAAPSPQNPRFGVRRHFSLPPWTRLVEVHWADDVEAYVTPVDPGTVGVALLTRRRKPDFDALLDELPALRDRLAAFPTASEIRGAGPFGQRARSVLGPRLALVGDATGSLDPISGEGIALALCDAASLASACAAGRLDRYPAAWRAGRRWPRRMTALLVLLADHPRLRRRVMRSLAAQPGLLTRFLAPRDPAAAPRLVGRTGVARLLLEAVAGGGRVS